MRLTISREKLQEGLNAVTASIPVKTTLPVLANILVETTDPVTMYKKPDDKSRPVAQIENGVVAKLNECEDNWCNVSASGYKGWVLKTSLWGVYEHEESK